MEKIIPQKCSFDIAEKLNNWYIGLSYFTAGLSFVAGIIENAQFSQALPPELFKIWLPGIILVLAVTTAFLHFIFTYQYQKAEEIRRDSFFDDSFGSLLADKQSEGYYSNGNISVGIQKALFNIDENCFHSLNTIQHMLLCRVMRAFPIGLLLLAVIAFNIGGHQFTMLALNLFLALGIVNDLIRLYRLKLDLEKVHTNCKTILSNLYYNETNTVQPYSTGCILREIVRYETALSYASTMFDSKFFIKNSSKTAKEWEEYKKKYLSPESVSR